MGRTMKRVPSAGRLTLGPPHEQLRLLPQPVAYCMYAIATTTPVRPGLHWQDSPPPLQPDQLLLVLAPAMAHCAFVGGAGGPCVVEIVQRAGDVVAHVAFPTPFDLEPTTAIVPRPAPPGRLLIVVHGSIMQPPGRWADAREIVVPVEG